MWCSKFCSQFRFLIYKAPAECDNIAILYLGSLQTIAEKLD